MTRKVRVTFTAEQKLEYAKLMILEKQLWRAKRDNEILKKAAAFFARENRSLN
jgi:transposase-like protein